MAARIYRSLLWIQGIYTLVTALWGLVHMPGFMAVTGPKEDIWLVQTVSFLLLGIAITLLSFLGNRELSVAALLLGSLTAAGLAFIDFYYASRQIISGIYMVDGVAELLFVAAWVYVGFRHKRI